MMHVSMMLLGCAALLGGSLLSISLLIITFRKEIHIFANCQFFLLSYLTLILQSPFFDSAKNYYRSQLTQQ
uniref:Uncharacterized protein n=1 Tax=Kalanchoe fedtschenkoi TaxID=63787 RepID=A0A7N0U3T4_KALFE